MVYLGLFGVVLNVLGGVLVASTHLARTIRKRVDALHQAGVVLDRFKRDVRAAAQARLTTDTPPALVLTYAESGRSVRYEVQGPSLVRCLTTPETSTARRGPLKTKRVELSAHPARAPRTVTLTLELLPGTRRAKRGFVLSTRAALRVPAPAHTAEGKP